MKIKPFLFSFGLLFILSGCSQQQKEEPSAPNTSAEKVAVYDGKIVTLGDSLTEGLGVEKENAYPARLQTWLLSKGHNYEVINSGISGETTTGLAERIEWVLSQNPDIIILTSGANDAIRGIDLEITKKNFDTIIPLILEKDITLLFSGMQIYENLGVEYVEEFKNLYPKIANEYKLPFIPFFLEGVAGNPELNNLDLIHPNKEGYKIIVEQNVGPELLKIFEE